MALPHAPGAQGGTGPGSRAADLTIPTTDDDRLANVGAGRSAHDGIVNVDPSNTRRAPCLLEKLKARW
ncbi:hypothetical protein AGABI1DRAFT_134560 [Agaricus bisporus var. burnettii JB137-S8]|uniref:Uncharacterized protein n=1 Tax=Agaricus bisporus var. burnettii (strain JB137-S8 / ATCC MYA-4627 / FGSC 10392) TaxID=597362 RepID=K5WE52_AGABU|nr:uncharacterized protein AGABI1DRAFT_134560 [Agaricus bisporus var. burnettii JB137-S8]EKM73536.1 hypothetical protein AGABI1DRAFT_134560 [Agaricus bisporus var. burnettii JB137-S8]